MRHGKRAHSSSLRSGRGQGTGGWCYRCSHRAHSQTASLPAEPARCSGDNGGDARKAYDGRRGADCNRLGDCCRECGGIQLRRVSMLWRIRVTGRIHF